MDYLFDEAVNRFSSLLLHSTLKSHKECDVSIEVNDVEVMKIKIYAGKIVNIVGFK